MARARKPLLADQGAYAMCHQLQPTAGQAEVGFKLTSRSLDA
jgi:hypothetical protein